MCRCATIPEHATALAVDVPAYHRDLTEAINEVLRGHLPLRVTPALHRARPGSCVYVEPHSVGTKLETDAHGQAVIDHVKDTTDTEDTDAVGRGSNAVDVSEINHANDAGDFDGASHDPANAEGPHISNAGRDWMDAAAEDMRRRTTGSHYRATGPAWTRGELEKPAGERDMGTWKAAVYTDAQKLRLGVDSEGEAVSSISEPQYEGV